MIGITSGEVEETCNDASSELLASSMISATVGMFEWELTSKMPFNHYRMGSHKQTSNLLRWDQAKTHSHLFTFDGKMHENLHPSVGELQLMQTTPVNLRTLAKGGGNQTRDQICFARSTLMIAL